MQEKLYGDTTINWYSEQILRIKHVDDWQGKDDLDTAKEVVAGVRSFTSNKPSALLIIFSSLYKKREILGFFQQQDVNDFVRAIVIKSFAAKLVGNMYLKIAQGQPNENGRIVPTKLFTNEEKAIAWLEQQAKDQRSTAP